MQFEVVPVMLNEDVLELEVGKEFQKRSSLFPVRDATTFLPSDQIPQGQASTPKSIAKLALAPVVVGIEFQTKIRLLSESATSNLLSGVITASLGQLH